MISFYFHQKFLGFVVPLTTFVSFSAPTFNCLRPAVGQSHPNPGFVVPLTTFVSFSAPTFNCLRPVAGQSHPNPGFVVPLTTFVSFSAPTFNCLRPAAGQSHPNPGFVVPLTTFVSFSAPTFNCLRPAAGQSHPIPVMSEPYCENMKEDAGVYYGVLKISGKEISSTFLPFKDEEKALELYTHLVEHHDNWILSCHHLVRYQDEWLVGLEYSKNIVTYFREKMEVWESSDLNQHEWFNYISEDFIKILKDIACFGLKVIRAFTRKIRRSLYSSLISVGGKVFTQFECI
ncbi:hypothetical protein ERO13_A06G037232v2 [Gossypium hirsutum]|nr:hypothetical protein ERO13_A06G037232v2 [Gossypium hirsutum]